MDKGIQRELKKVAKKYKLQLLVFFGSRVTDKYRENSDFDFAFYPEKNIDFDTYSNLLFEISNIIKADNIDLIDIKNNDDPILRKEILLNGMCIFEKYPYLFEEYKINSYFNYLDYLHYYLEIDEVIDNKLDILKNYAKSLEN